MSDDEQKGMSRRAPALSMIGCCFIIWGKKGRWQNQGVIRGEPSPGFYLCQYFSALDGTPNILTIFTLEELVSRPYAEEGSFILFEDDDALRFWIEHRYRPPKDGMDKDDLA